MQTNPSEKCIYCKASKTCELHHNLADMHKAIEDFQEIKLLPLIRVHSTQVSQPVVPEWEERFIELAHAYQEGVQPRNSEDFGKGFWAAIEYCKSFLPDLRNATLEQAAEAVRKDNKRYMTQINARIEALSPVYMENDTDFEHDSKGTKDLVKEMSLSAQTTIRQLKSK